MTQQNCTKTIAPLAEACMAGRSNRFWELIIDSLICYILASALSYLAGFDILTKAGAAKGSGASYIFTTLYYFICEAFFHGKTIGKSACGLRTVTIDGSEPGVAAIALRSICRLIPFSSLSVLFGNYWRGGSLHGNWYDRISGTYVIKDDLVGKYEELVKSTQFESRYRHHGERTEQEAAPQSEAEEASANTDQDAPLAEGDKVTFRYGTGEVLRVGKILPDGKISCYGFDENGRRVEAGEFPARYLDKAE